MFTDTDFCLINLLWLNTKYIYKIDQKCEVIFLQDNDKNLCIT